MDLDSKTMEKMAKEYAHTLASSDGADLTTLERLIILEEEQLDVLSDPTLRGNARINKTVAYLKNLTFRTLTLLSKAKGEETYIPSVRTVRCPNNNPVSRLLNTQIDVFILMDKLDARDKTELLILENRKCALLSTM